MKLLEKARADLPAKPTKAKAAAPTKTGKPGGAKVVKPAAEEPMAAWDDEPEPARPATAPAKGTLRLIIIFLFLTKPMQQVEKSGSELQNGIPAFH